MEKLERRFTPHLCKCGCGKRVKKPLPYYKRHQYAERGCWARHRWAKLREFEEKGSMS